MADVTVTLTPTELTHIRVGLLQRLDRLKKALDADAASEQPISADVRQASQTSYDEIRELMNGKLWAARQAAGKGE